jgi:hypothetical protein
MQGRNSRPVPNDLLGAVWLQFAQTVGGDKGFRRCSQCGLWFELAPEGGRKTKQFCSGTCRARAHRTRQEKIWELHRQGKRAKEIADEVGTDLATVKKWVKQRRGFDR